MHAFTEDKLVIHALAKDGVTSGLNGVTGFPTKNDINKCV